MHHLPFMLFFGVQMINRTFFFTLTSVNMLPGTLFVCCFFRNTLFLLFFLVSHVFASTAPILVHFDIENHHSDQCWLFLLVFFWRIFNAEYMHCTLLALITDSKNADSKTTLTFKNISDNLVVLSLSVNMLFLPFSDFLSWKCINNSYPSAVYRVNTESRLYFFLCNCWKRYTYFSCCPLALKTWMAHFILLWNL